MDAPDSTYTEESRLGSSALDKFSELAEESMKYVEQSTRRSPFKAIGCAVTAGYLLRHLPVFAIAGALLRLALILVRPLVLIFAGVKLCQYLAGVTPFKRAE